MGTGQELAIDGFHAFAVKRTGVFHSTISEGANHPSRTKALTKCRIFWVIRMLGLFLGIKVIEVAKKLIKTVLGGKKLVAITQVVFAILRCNVALVLQHGGKGGVLRSYPHVCAGDTHFGQARADR